MNRETEEQEEYFSRFLSFPRQLLSLALYFFLLVSFSLLFVHVQWSSERKREKGKEKGDKLPSFSSNTSSQLIQLNKTEEIIIFAQWDVRMTKSILWTSTR